MIAGMLRVKNEARWIGRVLRSIETLCDDIFIMDDHSTDDTTLICRRFENVTVLTSPFDDLDEARDKTWLLNQIQLRTKSDWILSIDGDEILTESSIDVLRSTTKSEWCAVAARLLYLWDSETQVRVDGIYRRSLKPCFFRSHIGKSFSRIYRDVRVHSQNIPANKRSSLVDAALLHLGYRDREDRLRKYRFYNAVDPHNRDEDEYRHMVIGDIFPADSRFKHAGPLTLVPLESVL